MRKIISLILATVMLITLFAGISVSAEETVMTAQRKRSAYAEESNILGNTIPNNYNIYGKGENISGNWVYDVPIEPDTHNLSAKLTSDTLCGVGVTGERTYFTLTPYAKIAAGVDAFMVYMELPEYNKYGEQWSIRSLSFWMYEEGGSSVWQTPCNMTIKYLENDSDAWVTTTVGANGEYFLPSGFKGYIKMYLNTATNGNSTEKLYDYLNKSGLNTADGFLLGTLQFEVNYLGGSYGDIRIGGMYNVITDGDALTANLSDEGGDHSKVAKLNGTDLTVPKGVATFWNQRANYEVNAGEAITYDVLNLNNFGSATRTWAAPAIGAKHPAMKIASETATGYAYNSSTSISSNMWAPIDPEIGAFAMYLELPRYAEGDQWTIQNLSFGFSDGTNIQFMTPVNMKISYLAIDGKEWVDSITSSSGQFYLPSGFKGYVKCYLKTATLIDTSTNFFEALKANGINYETNLRIDTFQFVVNRVGGEYGDLIIGGPYGLTADGDSLEVNFTDWKYTDNNVSKITTYEPTLTTEKICATYFDGTTYYEGAAVDTNTAKIWDLDWYNNYGDPAAALTWTAPVEPDTSNAAIRVHSEVPEGQGPEVGPSNLLIHPNATIHPEVGTFMMYVELPKQGVPGVDGPSLWANYTIKTNSATVYQNRSSAKYGRLNNMAVSYLERDGKEWVDTTCNGENLVLPNGFKGYIKLYLNTAINDTSTGETFYQHLESQGLDTTKEYRITDLNIVFGWLGGRFGDMVVGGMYSVTEDGDGIYANVKESGYDDTRICLTNYENDNTGRIELINKTLADIGETPSINDGDAIQNAVKAYNDLAAAYKDNISAETIEALFALEEAYNAYRPKFLGSTVKNAVYDDDQALRIDMTLDPSKAAGEDYEVVEYGAVVLTGNDFTGDEMFTAESANAKVYKFENIADSNVFNYSLLLETNSVDSINLDHYVRSYVVYSNGTNTITVWNAKYNRDAYTTTSSTEFSGEVAAYSEFYYHTSLLLTASYLDIPVLSGSIYGDVDLSGAIDVADLASLKLHLLDIKKCNYDYIVDINGNGSVDVVDLVRFKKFFAGADVTIGAEIYTTYSFIETPESTVIENDFVLNKTDTAGAEKDITVTSFNLGCFYLGTQYGITHAYGDDNAQKALNAWEEDFEKYPAKSDIYAFQEYARIYYTDTQGNKILPEDKLIGEGKPFKKIDTFYGYTQGDMEMGMAFGVSSATQYDVHNITYGYLCGKDTYNRRAYIKGYVTVKGVEVALISIHPGFPNNQLYWQDCANEIAALMDAEDYAIVLGDTNSNNIAAYLQSRGYNAANHGKFGAIQTYMYDATECIDNIFTTPNIDILSVAVDPDACGSSDHYPITAGLFVDTEMGSTKGALAVELDSLGFAAGRY